jgi:hypothetical protein
MRGFTMIGWWLLLALVIAMPVVMFLRFMREEERRNQAFVAHLERMSRECPACKPWGGYYLGKMNSDGSYETHTCEVRGGTGELPDA